MSLTPKNRITVFRSAKQQTPDFFYMTQPASQNLLLSIFSFFL